MGNTVIKAAMRVMQDDDATRDVWIDIAPTGSFANDVWQRMVWLDKETDRIVECDWRWSPNQNTGFEERSNYPPAAVLEEYQRIKPEALKLARAANSAFCITDDMLQAAAKIDDLDESVKSVMDQVGIDEGGVAGIVFSGPLGDCWNGMNEDERFGALKHWREVEQAYNIPYPINKKEQNQ